MRAYRRPTGSRTSNVNGLLLLLLLATLVISPSLLAVITDTIDATNNDVTTNEYNSARANDLQAALVTSTESCDGATYTEGPVTLVLTGKTLDLNNGGEQSGDLEICLRNNSLATGDAYYSVPTFTDVEVGPCARIEIDAGDTSCGDGDAGEAAGLISVWPQFVQGAQDNNSSPTCTTSNSVAVVSNAPNPIFTQTIDPGAYCRMGIFVSLPSGGFTAEQEQAAAVASTDMVTFTMRFDFDDGS